MAHARVVQGGSRAAGGLESAGASASSAASSAASSSAAAAAPASDTSEDEASPAADVELAESRAQLMLTNCGRPAPPQVTERYREILGGEASPAGAAAGAAASSASSAAASAGADVDADAEPIVKERLSLFDLLRKKQEEEDAYHRRMEELDRRGAAEVEASDAAGALLAD